MECKKNENLRYCSCTAFCGNKGICCDCVREHRDRDEIPGCFFPKDAEETYDRSITNFIKVMTKSEE